MVKTRYDLECNIAQTLNIIGDRWTLLILHELLIGESLFNDIKVKLPGLSANLLSTRLKSLEEDGLVKSELYSTHPPRYSYSLTEKGKALEPIFNAMIIWGSEHLDTCYKELIDPETNERVEIGYFTKNTKKRVDKVVAQQISKNYKN